MATSRLCAGLTTAALLTGLGAGVLGAAAPAEASTRHTLHRTFAAHGLVVSRSTHSMTVLARTLKTGKSVRHNALVKVAVPSAGRSGRKLTTRLRSASIGDTVNVTGIASGSGQSISFSAHGLADHATPFHAYLGVVTSVGTNSLQVVKADFTSDDPNEDNVGVFNVDTSNATVSVDGSVGTPDAGELVAILGSQADDNIVATSVWAYSTLPDIEGGEVQSVHDSVVTFADRFGGGDDNPGDPSSTDPGSGNPGDDNPGDPGDDSGEGDGDNGDNGDNGDDNPGDGDGTTSVDLSAATLVLNGTSGADAAQLTAGTQIIVLGTTDSTTGEFTADIALAFSHGCSSRHHGDGGRHGHGGDDGNDGGDHHGSGDDNPPASGSDG